MAAPTDLSTGYFSCSACKGYQKARKDLGTACQAPACRELFVQKTINITAPIFSRIMNNEGNNPSILFQTCTKHLVTTIQAQGNTTIEGKIEHISTFSAFLWVMKQINIAHAYFFPKKK